jgi:Domain of unknown function (DUF4258)
MDIPRLEYSRHARSRMRKARITEDEVEAIVYYPAWRRYSYANRIEHFGYCDDGRLVKIVTNASATRVVTVVEKPLR